MFLILSSTHMTAMIRVQFREMKPEPNHGFYLLKPTWNHMWSDSGPGLVKPETKSSLAVSIMVDGINIKIYLQVLYSCSIS